MPPKKRRGGIGARGRRGRPPKKAAAAQASAEPSPVTSPIFEQNETSSSNSSVLEEAAQPETKIKLETKIHKKFGIKYHVPDEVVTPKNLSPIVEDAAAATIEELVAPIVVESSEESSSPVREGEGEEKMDTELVLAEIQEQLIEDEIADQLHHLEVVDDVENIEMHDLENTVVLEYITHEVESENEGGIILTSDVDADAEEEEVYYVVEEETEDLVEELGEDVEEKVEFEQSEFVEAAERIEPIESIESEILEEPKMEVIDLVPDEVVIQPVEKIKVDKKVKVIDRPCRKSKRISLRGGRQSFDQPAMKTPPTPKEDVQDEPKEEILDETTPTETATDDLDKEQDETTMETSQIDESKEITEEIQSIDLQETQEPSPGPEVEPDPEPEVKDTKKTKKQPAEKKKPGPKTKKTKDVVKQEKEVKEKEPKVKEEKKKGKKQITFKMQQKGKKTKDTKIQTTSSKTSEKSEEEDTNIRRSSRIKTISTQKVRSRGKGLVKKDDVSEVVSRPGTPDDKSVFVAPTSTTDVEHKPVKVKSRWRRSSELEMRDIVRAPLAESPVGEKIIERKKSDSGEVERRLKQFFHLKENVYLTERISCKEAKKMVCDCFLTDEEIAQGEYGCGDDCLNRLLMIECGNLCTVGDRCTNKRFQKMQCATVEAFATEKKGLGIRAVVNIPSGDFVLEYVGEVLDAERFEQRAAEYSMDKNQHYYFMALRADAVIDATMKGNISRFINHSCEPNAETQKWTVNGELRIGFFSKRTILAGEEITFDYQFQRYGKEAQKCFCEAPGCRGWLGEEPDSEDESEEEEEEEDEDDEEEEEEVEEEVEGEEGVKAEGVVDLVLEKEEIPGDHQEIELPIKPVVKKVVKKEKPPKKERKLRELRPRRKPRMDRFEDLGLDEEIESLQSTGLKNQAQTLKLSRLMVRAKEPVQRTKLLKLLKKGEFPCRRLFLDYHGLRLIHGWMTDAQHLAQQDTTMESLRLEILQTLAMLPIPNKTMLQDSKVLLTVEKWSKEAQSQESPADSDSNSPKLEQEEKTDETMESESSQEEPKRKDKTIVEAKPALILSKSTKIKSIAEVEEDEIRKSTGMDPSYIKVIPDYNVSIKDQLMLLFDDDFVPLEIPVHKPKPVEPEQPKYDILVEIMALALKLLEEWSSLKEVFRIPKKERIEQMKEHEREADRRYKALSVEQETDRRRDRYRAFQRPSRIEVTDRLNKDRDRERDRLKNDRYSSMQMQTPTSKMNKHERRELFARQAEEEERRRKQEMWSKQNWMVMSQDPRMQGYDPSRNPAMQYMWNPQMSQYPNMMAEPNIPTTFNYPPPYSRIGPPGLGHPGHMDVPHGIQPLQPGMLPPNIAQPSMTAANMGTMPPMPNIPIPPRPAMPYQESYEDPSKVQFMGPIPPPAKLPPKWKTAKDKYGRPYYYHVKLRQSQWEPPGCTEVPVEEDEDSDSTSSSDTSSLTSSSSSEDSDSEDDTKFMMDIRKKVMEQQKKAAAKHDDTNQPLITTDDALSALPPLPVLSDSFISTDDMNISDISMMTEMMDKSMAEEAGSPLEGQIAEQPPAKKRRIGLVQEHIISPRTEEDRLQFREDVKKYKLNKEMVRKQKEIVSQQTKKQTKPSGSATTPPPSTDKQSKPHKKKMSTKTKLREMEANANSEESKKIKETFRAAMATVMVGILNPYRKPDCKEGRIVATEDFKHLARKLTHFVMLKELKHCDRIEELECTESVKSKAKEFVRKYMAKFGEVYQRPVDEIENF